MKKSCYGKRLNYLLVILFSLSSVLAMGQSNYNTTNWRFSNPRQFGFTILDVDFLDNNIALAVGTEGGIARTTDGGNNWTYGPFTFANTAGVWRKPSLSDVHFVSADVAYAVGSLGCMVKSTDGGVTWTFVNTPLYNNARNINTVWFINENTGYIGGQWNTSDSIPKLYVTNNGGATWDSLAAPASNGTTKVGFINNATYPSIDLPITAKAKEIFRIEFINNTVGYISGSGASNFPGLGIPNITSSTTCAFTGQQTTGSHNASLLWKFDNGTLTDYSISKERLGYTGFPATINCTSKFATVSQTVQQFRAINIINDSLVVMMSFNNNVVVSVRTGKNDSTQNINRPGVYEKGKFEVLNTGSAPPPGYPQIPAVQVLSASNPYHMKRAADGKLYATGNFARLWTSVDTGRNWVLVSGLPQGQNYSAFGTWALDIAPNGKFLTLGTNGVVADSSAGSSWQSNYKLQVAGAYGKIEFADCNNGMASGGSSIAVTNDGGTTWFDRSRSDFTALNISINSHAYVPNNPAKVYLATSAGTVYKSDDINAVPPANPTFDPVFANSNEQMWDVATIGNDSVWVVGYSGFSVPAASRSPKVFRSTNGGATWTTFNGFHTGSNFQNLRFIEFPTRLIGYVAGTRDTIWKTTDGGVTWNKLPLPTPGVTPQITYTDMFALNENVVFLTGNGFPRKVVFKTTDGGATWQDITSNILAFGGGNLNAVLFHDINNGYVISPGGLLFKTTNGGVSWTHDYAPTNSLFNTLAFSPKTVPPAITFENRKVFVSGFTLPNVAGHIMEYGNPANVNVNTTETVTNASCTNPTGGSITVNTTGGIAPYTYSINGGAFQSSNSFTGLTQGPKTIVVKDAFCGIITKTINIGFNDNLVLTTNNDTLVCAGAPVQMLASTNGTGATYAWSPSGGLSAANISNPVATVNSNAAYTVTATLNGCVRNKTINIGIKPNPVINAGPDKTIVDGDEVILEGSGTTTPASIAWTPNSTLTGANTYTPVAKPNTTTIYTLTVRDNNNCTSTDNMVVNVIPYCLKVMNAFTPNGDGQNDVWIVTNNGGSCTRQVFATVFNRYGNIVFKDDNYQNKWDGTYKGKPVADGTYYYAITYRLINGASITLKGDVTILR